MYARWALLVILPVVMDDPRLYMKYLGDLDHDTSTKAGRLFYRVQTLCLATISLMITIYCYRHRKERRYYSWLKIFEVMKKKIKASDLKITEYMAVVIWKKTLFTFNVYSICLLGYAVAVPVVLFLQNQAQILAGDTIVTTWVAVQTIWLYVLAAQLVGMVALFRCVAFYFEIRMKKLINDLRLMNIKDKEMAQMDRAEVLYSWLIEFNVMHVELEKYDKFWQGYFLIFYGIGFGLMGFELTCFTMFPRFLTWTELAVVGFCLSLLILTWVASVMQASRVHAQTLELYGQMNRFCLVPTHSIVQNKMDNFVKKFSARGRKIGFHCYNMFYLTHEFLFHVSLLCFSLSNIRFIPAGRIPQRKLLHSVYRFHHLCRLSFLEVKQQPLTAKSLVRALWHKSA